MEYLSDIHLHTVASSHAYSTIFEYIETAKRKNVKLIAITDHGTELTDGAYHKWHFQNLSCVPEIYDDVVILKGIEANIRKDGTTDCFQCYEQFLDIKMAGFHSPVYPYNDNITENTDAMIKVINSGEIDVITHPANKVYPIDFKEVCIAAKNCNVALEINSSRFSRKGSENYIVKLAQIAYKEGTKLVMGSDAHISFNLADFDLGYKILEDAKCPLEYLLNSNPIKIIDFLIERKHKNLLLRKKYLLEDCLKC